MFYEGKSFRQSFVGLWWWRRWQVGKEESKVFWLFDIFLLLDGLFFSFLGVHVIKKWLGSIQKQNKQILQAIWMVEVRTFPWTEFSSFCKLFFVYFESVLLLVC